MYSMFNRSMALSKQKADPARSQTLESAFDALHAAVVLLDRKGRILYVSQAAIAIIAAGDRLLVRDGTLSALNALEAAALAGLIANTVLKSATNGACQINPVFLSQAQGQLLRISAIPIAHAALQRLGTPARNAAILLLLRRTQVNARALTQMLHWVYGLTGAEIRLALLLHGGRALAECASENSVSTETVRAQLKAIFRKTGVHRQSHLLRLLSELALPD